MCRWIGAVPKATVLYRISTSLFYFLKIRWDGRFFVSTVKLYSTLGRLFKHLSNFHAIYFIFLPKDELCLSEIWDTVFRWCFCSNRSSLPWKSFPRRQNTTLQVRENDWQDLRFSLSTHQVPSGNSVRNQILILHPCWDEIAWVCPEGVESPPHPEVLSLLPSKYGEWRVMAIWTEHSAPLRMGHKWLPVAVSHKFEGSLQPCQIQMFSFALLVIKWLAIFLIGNTNCHSLHSF